MQKIQVGHSDIFASAIIMGTWQAASKYWPGVREEDVINAVHAALDSGIDSFDTAEEYGNGHSERVLARALEGKRNKVNIFSKVFSNHLQYKQVISACDKSLKNLKTDTIDLYQIHWPSGSWNMKPVPIEETMRALLELKKLGKIRAIGVSNFSLDQLKEAQTLGQIDSLQSPYSLYWRYIEKQGHLSHCQKNKISVLAYSPLAQGFLTGKFSINHKFDEGDNRARNKLFDSAVFPAVKSANDKLKGIADRKGITLAQLSLAWVVSHEGTLAVVGSRNANQIRENACSGEMELTPFEKKEIESITWTVGSRFADDPVPWTWTP